MTEDQCADESEKRRHEYVIVTIDDVGRGPTTQKGLQFEFGATGLS